MIIWKDSRKWDVGHKCFLAKVLTSPREGIEKGAAIILILSHLIFTLGGVPMLSERRVKSYEDVAAAVLLSRFRVASRYYVHVHSNDVIRTPLHHSSNMSIIQTELLEWFGESFSNQYQSYLRIKSWFPALENNPNIYLYIEYHICYITPFIKPRALFVPQINQTIRVSSNTLNGARLIQLFTAVQGLGQAFFN